MTWISWFPPFSAQDNFEPACCCFAVAMAGASQRGGGHRRGPRGHLDLSRLRQKKSKSSMSSLLVLKIEASQGTAPRQAHIRPPIKKAPSRLTGLSVVNRGDIDGKGLSTKRHLRALGTLWQQVCHGPPSEPGQHAIWHPAGGRHAGKARARGSTSRGAVCVHRRLDDVSNAGSSARE
jgi:hypothetical protein